MHQKTKFYAKGVTYTEQWKCPFTFSQVMEAIKKKRWPDNSCDMEIRYVRPDEGVWINVLTRGLSGLGLFGFVDSDDLFDAIFFGPVMIVTISLAAVEARVKEFSLDQYEGWLTAIEQCYLVPEGSIVLEAWFEPDGQIQHRCTIGCADHPQQRFNFDAPEHRLTQLHQAA